MSAKRGESYKLVVDTNLFLLPGGTKGDMRRLKERAQRAEDEGLVKIVDISSADGKYEIAATSAHPADAQR
jgi:hypothetical protein